MQYQGLFALSLLASNLAWAGSVEELADKVQPQVVEWRHHFHQHPELSNREFKTAAYVAKYLKSLGLEVQTGVGKTGVVAVLDSGKPGPVVALRADMDALPVKEVNNLPYRSEVTGEYNGETVPVMHACGHDTHIAMLMGAAKVLVAMKGELKGKVKFIFQPAEEGAPVGEEGGAKLMVKEGVLKNPDVDVVFGLHINSQTDIGTVKYRAGGVMAAVDPFKIEVHGKQSHGAYPWMSVDPVVTSAQLVMALQTIVSREVKVIDNGAVVSVGMIKGGNRTNIIPAEVDLAGTVRTLNPKARELVYEAMARKVKGIADSMGATATLTMPYGDSYPITYNDPALMAKMLPTLSRTAGEGHVKEAQAVTGAEDFSFYQEKVPGLFLFVGGKPLDVPEDKAPSHHTPDFYVDDAGMELGVKLLSHLTLDYMQKS
ncbi:MAG: amidohydrolase [Pseudomonadota bacterium]|uniref:amidohydrolase n=1 Tax=Gallaecimonas pentaromativorans TaxID=584787 RepID=UPI00067F63E1|nr:amidohydrolase [Gallaecimonas pentaromativorans]MED5525633.1 amidohydrolase [Pseudomonadota bacterium]